MANPIPDCKQIPELLSTINNTSAELGRLRGEMDELGFGTAKTLRLTVTLFNFFKAVLSLPPKALAALVAFISCDDSKLADLAIEELQALVSALVAHAQLQIASIPEEKVRTEAQAEILEAFQTWLPELNNIVAQFGTVAKPKLISLIKAAKQTIKTAAPIVLSLLVEEFGDEIAVAAANKTLDLIASRRRIIKEIAKRVVIAAIGEAAAEDVNPFIGVALTGWELLVELAGNAQATDLRDYINLLLVKLVTLMQSCGWKWVQNVAADPNGNEFAGFFVRGEKYKGATVVARPFIRCAKLVDGKIQFQDRCPVKFTTGATVRVKLTNEIKVNGRWEIPATIDINSVNAAPCITDAKYCYAYLQLTFRLADGTKTVLNIICGVKVF
jgi:hypothetical protein